MSHPRAPPEASASSVEVIERGAEIAPGVFRRHLEIPARLSNYDLVNICRACCVEIDTKGVCVVIKKGVEKGFEFGNVFVCAFDV